MLLTRRNEALEEVLKRELEGLRAKEGRGGEEAGGQGKGKKRGRPPGGGGAKGKGRGKV